MNRNVYYYKPYEKPSKFGSNRNNNFNPNNHKNGNFQSNNNFSNNSYHHRSSHHQGNVNRHNNNDNGSRITMTREREQDDWKRNKRNKQWKEKQPASSADQLKEEQMPPKWSREEAIKAIEIENAFNHLQSNQFVLRFPDPFIDKSIIQGYSSAIVDVRVQQPITPRFVYIQLQPETDAEKLKQELSKIQFGNGFLKLEKRNVMPNEHLKPEDIDPFTIFMGNIHPSTSIQSVKQSVEHAYRVDVGFAKKHKFGRYAFAKFRAAADARHAFTTLRQAVGTGGMDLVVRFRRLRGNIMTKNVPRKAIETTDKKEETQEQKIATIDEATTSSLDYFSSNLLSSDILDWDKLPMFNISPNNNNNSLVFASSSGTDLVGGDLDDLFNQLYSDVSSVFTDDSDFC